MTHEGPRDHSTSNNKSFTDNITFVTGSPHLRDIMINNKSKIVCNVHGHSHDGSVIQNIYKPCEPLPIINPGSLAQGEFGELIIRKTILGRWKV